MRRQPTPLVSLEALERALEFDGDDLKIALLDLKNGGVAPWRAIQLVRTDESLRVARRHG